MEKLSICPLCGSETCSVKESDDLDYQIKCKTYNVEFFVRPSIIEDFYGKPIFGRLMNLIAEKVIRQKRAQNGYKWVFFFDNNEEQPSANAQNYNLAPLLMNYPETFNDCIDRSLLNLSILKPRYGESLTSLGGIGRLFYPDSAELSYEYLNKHSKDIFRMFVDLGYVKCGDNQPTLITAEGWKHIGELSKRYAEIKQGFIAMSFSEETKSVRESFKKAIRAAGFEPRIMDEIEHNHQIVPEMLREIEKSKFLVMDVTKPNYGAYYEAGYALALGKEVIICCENKVFSDDKYERPHFDIAQTSQIRWSTEEELVERLTTRIKATVSE